MSGQKIKCLYITFNGLMEPLGQSQVLPYIKGLSSRGIKFYLISLEKRKDAEEAERIREDLRTIGVEWYKLRYFGDNAIKLSFSIFQCFLVAFYLVISKKIEVVHARAYYPMFSVLFLKRIFKLKLIFDMRGFRPEELIDEGRIKEKSNYYKLLKFFEKKSILAADYLITLTPEAAEIIKKNYKNKDIKIFWMPTCVDEDRFGTKDRIYFNNKFIVVYLGSLWSHYNMPAMIDFFNILKTKITNSHFLILANNEKEKLYPLFSEKGLRKEEYTILSVKPAEVPKYLKSSNLAISFIYDTYSKRASFPTKIAEYLICGLPVVINTQSGFLKDLIISNKLGMIAEKLDVESFEKKIEELLAIIGDKDTQNRCKEIAQRYLSKNICVNKYYEIYQELETIIKT